jgi:hypothetical protein
MVTSLPDLTRPARAARWLSVFIVAATAFVAAPAVASATDATHVPGSPAPAELLTYTWDTDGLASASSPLTSGLAQSLAFTKAVQWWRDNIDADEQGLVDLDWGAFGVYQQGSGEDWEVDGFVYNKTSRYYCFTPWEVTRATATTVNIDRLFAPYCTSY